MRSTVVGGVVCAAVAVGLSWRARPRRHHHRDRPRGRSGQRGGHARHDRWRHRLRRGGLHLQHRQVRGDGRAVHGVPQRRGRRRTRTGCTTRACADTSYGSGITRSGGGTGQLHLHAWTPTSPNRPVNYVSFWDACRFANWLHNGQPTGAQGAGTTETGAYTLDGYNGIDGRTIQRNAGWKWAVTSEDEWYKAAYYKGGSTNAGYWDYPTQQRHGPGAGHGRRLRQQRQLLHGTRRLPHRLAVLHDGRSASSRTPPAPTARSTRAATCGSGTRPSSWSPFAACGAAACRR